MKSAQADRAKRQCNQCGSDLIFVKEIIEDRDLSSPVTTVIYRCLDKTCQEDIDKKTLARVQYYKEQEKIKSERYKNRLKHR